MSSLDTLANLDLKNFSINKKLDRETNNAMKGYLEKLGYTQIPKPIQISDEQLKAMKDYELQFKIDESGKPIVWEYEPPPALETPNLRNIRTDEEILGEIRVLEQRIRRDRGDYSRN